MHEFASNLFPNSPGSCISEHGVSRLLTYINTFKHVKPALLNEPLLSNPKPPCTNNFPSAAEKPCLHLAVGAVPEMMAVISVQLLAIGSYTCRSLRYDPVFNRVLRS